MIEYVGELQGVLEIDILVCGNCGCWFGTDYGFLEMLSNQETTCPYCKHASAVSMIEERDDNIITEFEEVDKICAKYNGRNTK